MKFVRKHARFGATMLVLVVVLFLASTELSGISDALTTKQNAAKATLQTNYRALFEDAARFNGDPATIQGRRIQDRTLETNALTALHTDRMAFETEASYTVNALPKGAVDEMVNYLRKSLPSFVSSREPPP
jgi:hypothetical protein